MFDVKWVESKDANFKTGNAIKFVDKGECSNFPGVRVILLNCTDPYRAG